MKVNLPSTLATRIREIEAALADARRARLAPTTGWSVTKASDLVGVSVSATGFTETHRLHGPRLRPTITVRVITYTEADVVGWIRLTVSGVPLADPMLLDAGDVGTYRAVTGDLPGTWLAYPAVSVEARRDADLSSGTGAVRIVVVRAENT